MIAIRPAHDRGHTEIGWLDSRHTFSFGDYWDPDNQGFRSLRVLNDDRVTPGAGFGTHPHRDMEIVTYVLSGALAHKDSMGTGSTIGPGEVQRMSAGTGVLHSEYNASEKDPVHFLQIWFLPERRSVKPGYAQRKLDPAALDGKLALVVSKDGRDGSLSMNQDAALYAARLAAGQKVRHELAPGRSAWVHVATGSVVLGGRELREGDGAAITDEKVVELSGTAAGGEVLVFDLA